MEILTFDIAGKFAHFRKYYANNTAMTFTLPPRTTLMGIVAAMLGLPRDSYYKALSSERLRFSVRILQPVKKSFHRMNLLMIKGEKDFQGRLGHTQTPFEVVTGLDLRKDFVQYRVYVTATGNDGIDVFQILKDAVMASKTVFSLTLGTANFSAQVGNPRLFDETQWQEIVAASNDFQTIHSAVLSNQVTEIETGVGKILMEEELLPANFMDDYNRELTSPMWRILFSTDGKPMRLKLKGHLIELMGRAEPEFITFLD
jgi:CRISPR-associated protein Cas5h